MKFELLDLTNNIWNCILGEDELLVGETYLNRITSPNTTAVGNLKGCFLNSWYIHVNIHSLFTTILLIQGCTTFAMKKLTFSLKFISVFLILHRTIVMQNCTIKQT